MSTTTAQPATTPIPVQLAESEFTAFIFPHLSMPQRGPKGKLGSHRVFHFILWVLYTGMQWKCLPMPNDTHGEPAIHDANVYRAFAKWADDGALEQAFIVSVAHLAAEKHLDLSILHGDRTNSVAKKGAMELGTRGTNTRRATKSSAITENHGSVLAPLPVAPVNATDMALLLESLKALKRAAKQVGLDLRGAYLNLDGGFDSARNRTYIFNAGLIPNIPENPRNHKRTKRGRKRLFNAAIHAWRMRVERTFAWEDKCKQLLLRFERIQQRHYGMKLMAYTLINLRAFCGV
jgi:transposase